MLIEQGKNKVVSIEEVYSQGFSQREYFQTQVEILKSDELARSVVQKLKLTTHPDFDPRQAEPGFWARSLLGAFGDDEQGAPRRSTSSRASCGSSRATCRSSW